MGAQCPCTCRRRRPPASRVVVAPSTLAVQIHPPVSQPQDSVLAAHATWPRMRQLLSWRVYSFCFFVLVALSSFFLFPSEWIGLLVTVKHEEKGWRVGEGVVGALRDASGWLHSRGFQLGRAQSRV